MQSLRMAGRSDRTASWGERLSLVSWANRFGKHRAPSPGEGREESARCGARTPGRSQRRSSARGRAYSQAADRHRDESSESTLEQDQAT